jgi:hypothetical protein
MLYRKKKLMLGKLPKRYSKELKRQRPKPKMSY